MLIEEYVEVKFLRCLVIKYSIKITLCGAVAPPLGITKVYKKMVLSMTALAELVKRPFSSSYFFTHP